MKITFLLPGLGRNVPVGGFKVVYEYANRFVADGYDVDIVYICNPYTKKRKRLYSLIYNLIKYLYKHLMGYSGNMWFKLNKKIKEHCIFTLTCKTIPNSDCYVATAVSTAMGLYNLSLNSVKQIYFIQGYEDWAIDRDQLYETYKYNFDKIVISKELRQILYEVGQDSYYVPNAFDSSKFRCISSIQSRNPLVLSMIYHKNPNKGCEYGFKALGIIKNKYPNVRVLIFGTSKRPKSIPDDYEYYMQPNDIKHLEINNESAIFLAPSLTEGWGLTVGEAMMSGEAVVCTDNGGYREIAIDGYNALISPIQDYEAMANNTIRLIEDNALRIKIAQNGLESVQKYTWESSYEKFKDVILH